MSPTEAWLSILSGYVVAYRSDINYQKFAEHLENLMHSAKEIFVAAGAKGRTANLNYAAIDLIAKGKVARNGMPSPAYARALMAIRQDLRGDAVRRTKLNKTFESSFNEGQKQIANLAMRLLNPDPETVDKNFIALEKKISILPDRMLKTSTVKEVENSQPKHIDELRYLVKKFVGRNDIKLLPLEAEKIRKDPSESKKEQYKRYLEVHRQLNEVWKSFIRNMVREEGHHVKIIEAVRALEEAGIEHHWLDGLVKAKLGYLKINDECKLFDEQDRPLNGAIPQPGSEIIKNPKYTPHSDTYVFMFKIPGAIGKGTTVYRTDSVNAAKDEGTNKVVDAIPIVPTKRPIWLKDLNSSNSLNSSLATIVELVNEFTPRIGSPGNGYIDKATGKKVPTYGLSTLLVKHVTVNGNVLILKYRGKDGVLQKHILKADGKPEHMKAISNIKKLLLGKEANDYVWTTPRGARITGTMVNNYLANRLKLDISIHEFRDVKGTALMQKKLENTKIPKAWNQKQIGDHIKKLALDVGKLLGHKKGGSRGGKGGEFTGLTAIKSYISPKLIADVFKERNMQVPNWVPVGGRGD